LIIRRCKSKRGTYNTFAKRNSTKRKNNAL